MTLQEENALRTFSMSHEGRSIARSWTGNLTISGVLLMFFVVASFLIMGLLILTAREIAGQMQEMVPIFRNLPVMHTRYCLMALYLLRLLLNLPTVLTNQEVQSHAAVAGPCAPAKGLTFVGVEYPENALAPWE